jgi:hypothetical protein
MIPDLGDIKRSFDKMELADHCEIEPYDAWDVGKVE